LAAVGAAVAGPSLLSAQTPPVPPARGATMVAMPISIAILAGPKLDYILGDMKERGGVNALFPFMYSHEEHRAGVPEGVPGFRGGNYATPHMQYYRDAILTYDDMKAPEFGGVDVLERVIPAAAKHGIKIFPFVLEDNHCPAGMPHWEQMYEIDVQVRRVGGHPAGPCKRNPHYRAWLGGLVEDYARSYDIGGMMWGAERGSGFLNVVSGEGGTRGAGGGSRATCFCEFCQKAGREAGIDVPRAKAGFIELEKLTKARHANQRPRDGYFSSFWRVVLNYPELIAWENLWVRGRHDLQAELYQRMKAANAALPLGWHVWQTVTFSPFQRAEEDYGVMKHFSDFVRPAVYNNCAGERFQAFARTGLAAIWGDLPPAQTADVLFRQLGDEEAPYEQLPATGLSADYVKRETRRAVEGVAGTPTQVWPGIDIDVPVPAGTRHCTPEGVKAAVQAVFAGGGNGIILSRNYVEMKPENLSAAGDALRELGLA
jgi:hypothetical protein